MQLAASLTPKELESAQFQAKNIFKIFHGYYTVLNPAVRFYLSFGEKIGNVDLILKLLQSPGTEQIARLGVKALPLSLSEEQQIAFIKTLKSTKSDALLKSGIDYLIKIDSPVSTQALVDLLLKRPHTEKIMQKLLQELSNRANSKMEPKLARSLDHAFRIALENRLGNSPEHNSAIQGLSRLTSLSQETFKRLTQYSQTQNFLNRNDETSGILRKMMASPPQINRGWCAAIFERIFGD